MSRSDDLILNYMTRNHEDNPEPLAKAMNKAGLVQKEVQVQGKNGQMFTRKQWVKAGEDVKQPKQTAGKPEEQKNDSMGKVVTLKNGRKATIKSQDKLSIAEQKEGKSGTVTIGGKKYDYYDLGYANGVGSLVPQQDNTPKSDNASDGQSKSNREAITEKLNKKYGNKVTLGTIERQPNHDKGEHEAFFVRGYYKDNKGQVNHISEIQYVEKKSSTQTGGKDSSVANQSDNNASKGNQSSDSGTNQADDNQNTVNKEKQKSRKSKSTDLSSLSEEKFKSILDSALKRSDIPDGTIVSGGGYKYEKAKGTNVYQWKNSDTGKMYGSGQVASMLAGFKDSKISVDMGDEINVDNDNSDSKSTEPVKKEESTQSTSLKTPSNKQDLVKLLQSGASREDIMAQAEKDGITWKKSDHPGINWMRASMAMTGTSTRGSKSEEQSVNTKVQETEKGGSDKSSPVGKDYTKSVSGKEADTTEGQAHNMIVSALGGKKNPSDFDVRVAAGKLASEYVKNSLVVNNGNNGKLADKFVEIAGDDRNNILRDIAMEKHGSKETKAYALQELLGDSYRVTPGNTIETSSDVGGKYEVEVKIEPKNGGLFSAEFIYADGASRKETYDTVESVKDAAEKFIKKEKDYNSK